MNESPSSNLKSFFVLLCCAFSLIGCSSLNDKAEKLMREKSFEEAGTIYQEMLRKDSHNTDAILGLKKAREGAISSELILVRRQRLGGNSDRANENLRNILLSLKDWKVYPTGPVKFTQNEEMDYAVQDIQARAQNLFSARHPLKVAYLLDRYSDFFQEKNLPLLRNLRNEATKQGLSSCRSSLASTSKNLTYYQEFLARECSYWGDTQSQLKQPIQHGLFGRLQLQGVISGIPEALRARVENELQHFLQDSPWFDAASPKILNLAYSGSYSFSTERRATEFTHAYEEQEPYDSRELVLKHRTQMVPVSKQEVQPDGHLATVNTTEARDDMYSEMETITRYRTVTHHFNYPGVEIEQLINLKTLVSAKFDGSDNEFKLVATAADRNLTSESQTEIPVKNLYARKATILEETEWFAKLLDGWNRQNLEQLRDIWVRKNCQTFQSDWSAAQQADRVFACLRLKSRAAPGFIDAWLLQNLGLPSGELRAIFL